MSAQKAKLPIQQTTQTPNAISILLIFRPIGVSCRTVEMASTKENAESSPSRNIVRYSKIFQKFAPGSAVAAVGSAM